MSLFVIAELAFIAACAGAVWLTTGSLKWELSYGTALCYGAALLLGQGLLRDLAIIARRKLKGEEKPEGARLSCLCAESSLGLLVIALGSAMLLVGIEDAVVFGQQNLTLTVSGVLVTGFLIKDYVVIVRKEKGHQNLIVW